MDSDPEKNTFLPLYIYSLASYIAIESIKLMFPIKPNHYQTP